MELDEMQATDKAEIVNQYRSLLTDFWKADSRFSAQTLATEEKKKSETNSAKNEYDSTDRSLLHRKNSALDRIHTEESSIRNSAEEKRNQISESAKTSKDALNEIAFGHFVSLSDDRNIQIESDIDLVRALDSLVSKTQRSANNIKNAIEDYKKWKESHSKFVGGLIIAGVLIIIGIAFLGKREWDIYKTYKSGKELYQQKAYRGAIEKFEALQTNSAIFMGNAYYQEIRPLLDSCYYYRRTSPLRFRDKPAMLSDEEVKTMLAKYGFYDRDRNKNGKGVRHRYEPETIADDKVVHDEASGLIWQQSGSPNTMPYAEVKKYIDDLNAKKFSGYSDWRLPTLEEAMSLMEPKENASGMHIDPKFDSTNSWFIWTSDTYSAGEAWVANFSDGYCDPLGVDGYYRVRAVR